MFAIKLDLVQMIQNRDYEAIKALMISKMPLLLIAAVIIVAGFIISNFIGGLIVKGLRLKGVDSSTHSFIKTICVILMKFVFILSALSTLGMNINSFIAALAAGGITAGLGLQNSVSQFASGIQILVNHPFKSGDFIDIGSVSGTVREIKIMYTVLITLDNRRVVVPNSTITTSNIINYNAENKRRIDLIYSVSYGTDIDKAREALVSVASAFELIAKDPPPAVAVKEHGSSSINLVCMVWCDSRDYWPVFFYMQEEVKKEFDRRDITIPFNQLDVHISQEQSQ